MHADNYLVGVERQIDSNTFIKVLQINERENGYWVTYIITHYNSIPRKLVMPLVEYKSLYGKLY